MKKIIDNAIKQFTTVYHIDHGKGHVISVTYRRDNNLVMCYFPSGKTHEWIGETQLRSGVGDITLRQQEPRAAQHDIPDSLQAALEGLFAPKR